MTLLPPNMADRIFCPARDGAARGATAMVSAMAHVAALALLLTVATRLPPAPPDVPAIPFSAPLEKFYLPSVDKIVDAATKLLNY